MRVNITRLNVLKNDLAMPFDCGDRTSLKHGTRPINWAKETVSWARKQLRYPRATRWGGGC